MPPVANEPAALGSAQRSDAERVLDRSGSASDALPPAATAEALTAWAADAVGGRLARFSQISGGNRCRSWAVDAETRSGLRPLYLRYQPPRPPSVEPYTVRREAQAYRALDGSDVPAPRLLAEHDRHEAILTERAP